MTPAIITDSTSDLTSELAGRYGIGVVPLFINFGEERYRDSVDLSRREYYRKLATERALPSTSQPTSTMFEDAFRPHVEAGRPIVCITIMASLSGTINAATGAAAQFPGAEIHIVDSETVAGGLGLQALHAATLVAGGADTDAVLAALARDRATQHGYATIPDLSHAVRSGRVSKAEAFVGSLVKIVPVLRFDSGRVDQEAKVRTFARAQDTILETSAAGINAADGAYICVLHTDAPDIAVALAEKLRARMTTTSALFETMEAGPAIATHAGPGVVAIFYIPG